MPAISVIIPLYNAEAYIKDCLDSLVAQTFSDFEVIIIDDGSTDGGARIAASFASSDNRFKLIGQPNKGPSEARNTGLKIMRGDYVTFIDSDDCVAPNFLETLFFIAQLHKADIACCSFQNIDEEYKADGSTPNIAASKVISAEDATRIALYQDSLPDYSAWNKLFRADLWKERRFPVGILFEDLATIPEVMLNANKVAVTNSKLYLYRKHSTSILASYFSIKNMVLLDTAENVLERMKQESKALYKAARSMLVSASFSILMRSKDTEEFADYRKRAFASIKKYRLSTFFDLKIRMRNRIAIMLSYLPRFLFLKFLKKGLS